ncbi:MAG TPA: hypothetical protein VI729_09655 [Anaerolineales bacterium]|nr:hypothetical protein [Anaerolineales bacterium]
MSTASHRESLFRAHSQDLESIHPELANRFMCPICHRLFSLDDIGADVLTVGHIWPEDFRSHSQSELARHQHILLCHECNSNAGRRGDKQAQVFEGLRRGEESGDLFGERLLEARTGPGEEPIRLRARVRIEHGDDISGKITFEVDQQRQAWARNDPRQEERFRSLARTGERFSVLVHPDRRAVPELARAGWITSAYLNAFHTFGYRYILQDAVIGTVRPYILNSIYNDVESLHFPESEDFAVFDCSDHPTDDPVIAVVIPAESNDKIHLRVSFLKNEVSLPFPFVPKALGSLIFARMPDYEKRIAEIENQNAFLYLQVSCTKLDAHDCIWDYVLGKPFP